MALSSIITGEERSYGNVSLDFDGAEGERARQLYEKSGYQSGREVEFWLEAERQLREELNA